MSGCFDNRPGLIIVQEPSCSVGYYCPNIKTGNISTLPVQCNPSPACAEKRLMTSYCDEEPGHPGSFGAQGLYEPGNAHIYGPID